MKREEAIQEIKETADALDGYEGGTRRLHTALTTLAPAVRYEPPTPKEVGYRQKVWGWSCNRWCLVTGSQLRQFWKGSRWGSYTAWLPLTAIPKGGAS